jgi:signal transduction histidine kinase
MADPLPQSDTDDASARRAQRIRDARVRIYYGATPGQFVALIVAGFLAFMLWGVVSPTVLTSWIAAQLVVWVLRTLLYVAYRRTTDPSHPRWSKLAAFGAATSGTVWGAGGFLMFSPGSFEYQLLVLVVFVWMGISAVVALSAHLPAFFGYLPAALLPLAVRFLVEGGRVHVVLGVLLAIFVVTLSFYGRQNNRSLTETLKLRFENVDLVERLARKSEEAERANIGKSKFLAAASHDLRQPLQALSLFTSVLSDQATEPKMRTVVEKIGESVRALQQMFDVLLDVSRLDAGVMQPAVRNFRLGDLCLRLASDYAPEAEAKGLQFSCNVSDAVARSDPQLLEQILRNLVANAVRYTERGAVRVDWKDRGSEIEIRVSDTGIGIPADQQRAIFEEFHQLGNPERDRTKGLGMGLAIVDRVAKLLGHDVHVESTPGKGSCFSVVVPRGDAAAVAIESAVPAAVPGDLTGLRVVVIDDDGGARTAMTSLLEHWGCKVIGAGSQAEALTALPSSGGELNAIIADYRLRDGRDGVEAIAAVRGKFGADIPALIVTGDIAPDRLREVKASGHQVAHKPVLPVTLRAFLANARARVQV